MFLHCGVRWSRFEGVEGEGQRTVLAEMLAKEECERGVLAYSEEFWGQENAVLVAWAMTTGGTVKNGGRKVGRPARVLTRYSKKNVKPPEKDERMDGCCDGAAGIAVGADDRRNSYFFFFFYRNHLLVVVVVVVVVGHRWRRQEQQ